MEVNRLWWDGTTREIYASETIGDTPVVVTLQNLSSKIQANLSKYEGVQWDKTICPWKINHNSDFFKKQWDNCYFKNNTLVVSQAPLFKERKKGYTFYLSCAGGNAGFQPHEIVNALSPLVPQYLNCLSRPNINLNNSPEYDWINDKYRCNFPVINFDYSRICTAIMIHNIDGQGHLLSENDRLNWDGTGVYGISVMFFTKTANSNAVQTVCMGIVSLNNEIQSPPWDTTDCWNDEFMCDNGLALTWCNAWDSGFEIGGMQTLGSSFKWYQESINNPGFREDNCVSDNVAGAIYYFPIKNIPVDNPAADEPDSVWDDNWESFYAGGDYPYGIRRHLKSNISFDEFCDYCKQQLAYLGFRFCIDTNHLSDAIDSQYFYIPEIDSVGVTTGNYYAANTAEAHTLPNDTWNTNVYEQTPYDGTNDDEDEDEDPNTYSDQTDWHFDIVSPNSSFIKLYLLDQLRVESLHDKFYESLQSKPSGMSTEEFFSDTYLTNNPTDVIISLRYFNINLESAINTSPTAEEIKLGAYQTGISAKQPVQTTKLFDYGSCIYYPHFGDFRDYAPYSSAQLIIPYCGTVDIDPAQYMNTTINVKMLIDFASGACTAYILRNNLVIDSISGQIGIDLPVTGVASQDLLRNLFNGSQNLKAAKNANVQGMAAGAMGFISSALSGNYMGMASAAMNTMFNEENTMLQKETADFNLHHTNVPFRQIGAVDPMISTNQEQQCRLLVYRPIMGIESQEEYDSYAHTIGYACYDNAQLSGYTGFTVCAAADTSGIPATLKERAIIKQLLLSGIYL